METWEFVHFSAINALEMLRKAHEMRAMNVDKAEQMALQL
jgi:hypothetical protein